ncbi:LysR family transcriptional regulator [Novosphingobium sp. KA1]|uniref:LysR family transcriptional regulator n=1 Tax=Novosphingobium sp. (strain KA1) TaxID=164608 RepID=UPI001A8DC070|nr:LysR family transcriptional regulator [Novosphingobium sp. KA1]QSR20371.1 transcriptional regulator [Novosphingobium sp. KA1]
MLSDIRSLDLNLLKALDALIETRSVTRAAERLGLTQPAVSGMLTRLREAFQDPLFIRAQRGMLPTPRAEALAGRLKAALREIEVLLQPDVFDPASAEMTISIAATDYAQRVVILPFLTALRRIAPGVRVSIRPVDMAAMATDMEQGHLDFALITPEMAPEHLRARRLFEERYVCVMRQGHPAARAPLDLDAFCALDHALMSHDGTQFHGATDRALDALARRRRVVLSAPNFSFVLDLIRNSDTCSLLPERLVRGLESLCLRDPPLEVPGFSKILVWHERSHHAPAMAWLRERLATSCI